MLLTYTRARHASEESSDTASCLAYLQNTTQLTLMHGLAIAYVLNGGILLAAHPAGSGATSPRAAVASADAPASPRLVDEEADFTALMNELGM